VRVEVVTEVTEVPGWGTGVFRSRLSPPGLNIKRESGLKATVGFHSGPMGDL